MQIAHHAYPVVWIILRMELFGVVSLHLSFNEERWLWKLPPTHCIRPVCVCVCVEYCDTDLIKTPAWNSPEENCRVFLWKQVISVLSIMVHAFNLRWIVLIATLREDNRNYWLLWSSDINLLI